MNSEIFLTDDVTIEDFQEMARSSEFNPPSENSPNICKTVLSDIVLTKKKPITLISHIAGHKSPVFHRNRSSETKFSRCLDNFEMRSLGDNISLGSESNDETCSGSSLQRFDSPNNSDSFDEETFLEDYKRSQNKIESFNNSRGNEFLKDIFLNELRTAIKIKWIDRAIYIKKTVQQRSQGLWDSYFKCLTSEEQFALSEIQRLKINNMNHYQNTDQTFEEIMFETLNVVCRLKYIINEEEVQFYITESVFYWNVPKVMEIIEVDSLTLLHPRLQTPLLHAKKIQSSTNFTLKKYDGKFSVMSQWEAFPNKVGPGCVQIRNIFKQRKCKIRRSKSESKNDAHDSNENMDSLKEESLLKNQIFETLRNKNKRLLYEINNRENILAQMQHRNKEMTAQINQKDSDLQSAFGLIRQQKSDLMESTRIIHQYEGEIFNLHKINNNLELSNKSTQEFIQQLQQKNDFLTKEIENLNGIEYDYQWLSKAFVDYKNLAQDYDNMQYSFFEGKMELANSAKTIEALQIRIKYLEQELLRINNEEIQKTIRSKHENCACQPVTDCSRCSHSRGHSRRSKHKKERRYRRQSSDSDEIELEEKSNYGSSDGKNYQEILSSPQRNYEKPKMDIRELERKYDSLQIKKRSLESDLCHVPVNGITSIRQSHASSRGEKEFLENELDAVDQEISCIRRVLKQHNVIGDRNAQ